MVHDPQAAAAMARATRGGLSKTMALVGHLDSDRPLGQFDPQVHGVPFTKARVPDAVRHELGDHEAEVIQSLLSDGSSKAIQ
jgi:hypothetical protein